VVLKSSDRFPFPSSNEVQVCGVRDRHKYLDSRVTSLLSGRLGLIGGVIKSLDEDLTGVSTRRNYPLEITAGKQGFGLFTGLRKRLAACVRELNELIK